MTRIVHVQTTVQTVFGLLDDDGNVVPQQPVVVNIGVFKPEAFGDAHGVIAEARDQALANYETEQAETEQAETNRPAKRTRRPKR